MKRLTPMLLSSDLRRTITFYTDILGFELGGTLPDGGEPEWCVLRNGGAELMFYAVADHEHAPGEEHDHPEPSLTGGLYLYPDDVDACYASINGRWPASEPRDQPYGLREFSVCDPDGYRIWLGS